MTESERLLHFAREVSGRLGGAMHDMVPPEAQLHLLNAQRELLTALFLIYEHQAGARRPPEPAPRRRRGSTRGAGEATVRPRVSKIDIE